MAGALAALTHRRGRCRRLRLLAVGVALVAMPDAVALGATEDCFAAGTWQGTLAGVHVIVRLTPADAGLRGTLDSPDQGATGIPMERVACAGDSLRFECPSIGGGFAGRREGQAIVGVWRQAGMTMTLRLERTEKPAETRRPQDPVPPLPYDHDSVTFENPAAGIRLAGTLTRPRTRGRHPAVLLVSGSGPQDRDETVFGHHPFRVLADALTRRGIAVLRVDDRGTGSSTGRFADATLHDFASDAAAGLLFLRSRPEVDPGRTGLIGHSEGGWVAPMVAAEDARVAFVALLAAPGVGGEELLLLQGEALRRAAGLDSTRRARETRLQRELFEVTRQERDSARAAARTRGLIERRLAELPDAERAAIGDPAEFASAQARMLLSPWFRGLLVHDPIAPLRRLRCPVLAMTGERDLQVPPRENLAAIERALRSGGNRDVTIRELAGLNHLFQTAPTGMIGEYAAIQETFAPAALDTLASWVAARAGVRP